MSRREKGVGEQQRKDFNGRNNKEAQNWQRPEQK
jgi:hypothetical protein